MSKQSFVPNENRPRVLLVAVHSPFNKTKNIQSYYDEFLHLVSSNGLEYDEVVYVKLRSVDTGYFLTTGKLEEIRALCEEKKIREVIFSDQLTAMQERNLSELLHSRVYDRTQLILEIFEKSAHSAEGKLQVEIAMFHHKKSRMAGAGVHMSQQAGRIGTRGPGETAKEKETRHIETQVNQLKKELAAMQKVRETQRKRRLESGIPQICLVGYTNTGKSTILNHLTKANVLAQNKLFATLDTTTRELFIDGKKKGVISDTVGFIQQLPHQLIDAFKSTLDELRYADLLLHIIDISDPDCEEHIKVVTKILHELGVEKEMLYVFNKADTPQETHLPEAALNRYQPNVVVSARTREGLEPLIQFLREWHKTSSEEKEEE